MLLRLIPEMEVTLSVSKQSGVKKGTLMTSDVPEVESKPSLYDLLSRREVRSLIFHLIYAMEGFDYTVSLESIIDMFNRGYGWDIPTDSEVAQIAQAVIDDRLLFDGIIKPLLANWRLERVGLCTKLILRMSVWELKNTETASSIVINEAIELTKCFSEKDAYRFVNGVLDEFCKKYKKEPPADGLEG